MPAFAGKYQYLDEAGATLHQGPCQLKFDNGTCIVTPSGATPPAFDLRDIDRTVPFITRGLALVNFRREQVYLPDASLEQQPRYYRYAVGAQAPRVARIARELPGQGHSLLARKLANSSRIAYRSTLG